jgi:polyisoprenoid-binding protein YceI
MMKSIKFYSIFISALAFFSVTAIGQDVYKLQPQNSKLTVEGTSTVHDWEVEATEFNAETSLQVNQNSVEKVSSVLFTTPAEGLKSGKGIMDNKIKDALKTKKHPEIKFLLKENEAINGEKGTISGILTIAGQTREVDVTVNFDARNPQKLGVTGEVPLKMSDFNIEQPTAMLGTIKTGDEVVVKFDLEFLRSNEELTRSN